MPSKAYQRLSDRVKSYDSDLELADLLVGEFLSKRNSDQSISEALNGAAENYEKLHARTNNRQSRKIVGLHLKRTLKVSFIKDLFEDFSEFLLLSLSRAALAGVDPARFAGDVKLDIKAQDILGSGSWSAVVQVVSDKVFRAIENEKSTKKLIEKVSTRLGLNLDKELVAAAMPYLDARHILVHRDGKPDRIYTDQYPDIVLRNGKISMSYDFVSQARATVLSLGLHIDQNLVAANLVKNEHMTHSNNAN